MILIGDGSSNILNKDSLIESNGKAAHTGKIDYGHNFYAKDADALDIMLPTKDDKPDYNAMAMLISAVQKLVIKDVVLYADRRIIETRKIVV